ncbi:MAG: calcium-binding protein [Microcoleaceae cyanobacterium]
MTSSFVNLGIGFFGVPILAATDLDDTIFLAPGEAANAEVLLLAGNDSLQSPNINDRVLVNGNAGDDTMTGGFNDDTIFGGQGGDRVFANSGSDQVFGNLGSDVLEGGFNLDTLYGGQGDDELFGDEGNDLLFGDRDNDILDGDGGRDDLLGGEGDDTFVFDDGEANRDVLRVDAIGDFTAGDRSSTGDKIAIREDLRDDIDPISLERNIDVNQDGFFDIALQLFDGRFLGVLIDDGNLPNRLDLDIDFIFAEDDEFDFNL